MLASDQILLSEEEEAWLEGYLPRRLSSSSPSEVLLLQYTSGSTGAPKGVTLSSSNLLTNIESVKQTSECSRSAGVGAAVALVSWLPQYHDMGLIGSCIAPAILGWRAELMSPASFLARPAAWLQAISRLASSHLVISAAPSFGYAVCASRVTEEECSTLSLSHWRVAMIGAEPIRERTLKCFDELFGRCGWRRERWACVYGLAESTLYAVGTTEVPSLLPLDRSRLQVGERPIVAEKAGSAGGGIEGEGAMDSDGGERGSRSDRGSGGGSVMRAEHGVGAEGVRWISREGVSKSERAVAADAGAASDGSCGWRCVGCALPSDARGQRLLIVHPDLHMPLADGCVGEIWLAGPSVARGYWNHPEDQSFGAALMATLPACSSPSDSAEGQVCEDTRYLRTGDLGLLHRGRLYIVGRLKDVLLIRGRTLHAADVEECVERHHPTAVRSGCCAAFAIEGESEEGLALMIEILKQTSHSEEAMEALVRSTRTVLAQLLGVKPCYVMLLKPNTLPKTTSGKLRRAECCKLLKSMEAAKGRATDREALVHVWCSIGREEESDDDGRPAMSNGWSEEAHAVGVLQAGGELVGSDHALCLESICKAIQEITFTEVNPDEPLDELGLDSTDLFELEAELRKRANSR
ncbi:MAG: hypothetical protein SGPRY_014387, partial [Prymnesium sp.]